MPWDHRPNYDLRPLGPRCARGQIYDGFGFCIYCRDVPSYALRDEHIVGKALGGKMIIRRASCHPCEAITHAFEGHAAHQAFLHQRLYTGLKKSEPQKLTIHKMRDGTRAPDLMEPKDYQVFGHFPVYPPAQALLGIPPSMMEPAYASIATAVIGPVPRSVFMASVPIEEVPPDAPTAEHINIDLREFSRSIAKIAFCFAAVNVGLDAFESLVPDYILGNIELGSSYFVGSDLTDLNRKEPEAFHRITIDCVYVCGVPSVVATVRLFAVVGSPAYRVYLGRATGAGWSNLA